MPLTTAQKKALRALAHPLSPVVTIADKGLTSNVQGEIERALDHHELIKIRVRAPRETRTDLMAKVTALTGGEVVMQIGQVLCLYRPNPKLDPKRKIALPR